MTDGQPRSLKHFSFLSQRFQVFYFLLFSHKLSRLLRKCRNYTDLLSSQCLIRVGSEYRNDLPLVIAQNSWGKNNFTIKSFNSILRTFFFTIKYEVLQRTVSGVLGQVCMFRLEIRWHGGLQNTSRVMTGRVLSFCFRFFVCKLGISRVTLQP